MTGLEASQERGTMALGAAGASNHPQISVMTFPVVQAHLVKEIMRIAT